MCNILHLGTAIIMMLPGQSSPQRPAEDHSQERVDKYTGKHGIGQNNNSAPYMSNSELPVLCEAVAEYLRSRRFQSVLH